MRKEPPAGVPPEWQWRDRPPLLSRRFQFSGYSATRDFLDALTSLSEESGYYPDTSFGVNYVNVTIHASSSELEQKDFALAARIDALMPLAPDAQQ